MKLGNTWECVRLQDTVKRQTDRKKRKNEATEERRKKNGVETHSGVNGVRGRKQARSQRRGRHDRATEQGTCGRYLTTIIVINHLLMIMIIYSKRYLRAKALAPAANRQRDEENRETHTVTVL